MRFLPAGDDIGEQLKGGGGVVDAPARTVDAMRTPDASDSERGAILIQVAVAILVLSAFAMFVVDYGVLWVSRNQAQNAADAGALAGAVALAFDDFDDRADTGPAKQAAQSFALANEVFGEDADVDIATDVRFYRRRPGRFPGRMRRRQLHSCRRLPHPGRAATRCRRVFGWLVGVLDQGVRATATAQVAIGERQRVPEAVGRRRQVGREQSVARRRVDARSPRSIRPARTPTCYIAPSGGGPGHELHLARATSARNSC